MNKISRKINELKLENTKKLGKSNSQDSFLKRNFYNVKEMSSERVSKKMRESSRQRVDLSTTSHGFLRDLNASKLTEMSSISGSKSSKLLFRP
jgi:hypothetical protein